MSETFVNQAFNAGQAATGVLALDTFTGTNIASGVSTISINGNVNLPGSPVTVNANLTGLVGAGLQGTYVGFSQPQGTTEPIYFFSVSPGGLALPVTVAVSAGQLSTASLLAPVNTAGNVSAPDSPTIVCFASGTRIRTPKGEVRVEELNVGDIVVTTSGAHQPIRWMGQRTIVCEGRADLAQVLPVRIAAGAFGEGRPARDLFVSPAHAIAINVLGEVLIPAVRLINGATITQVDVESVSYWHIELDNHDILIADGLPAESYLDCGNRRFFANADATDLHSTPDVRLEGPLPFCRPFHEAGSVVDLVRARLQDRAEALGWSKVEETFADLHLIADGRTIRPSVEGLTARFVLPADVRDVRLISATSVPAYVVPGSSDDRRLGLPLAALTIDDGLTGAREVALDDTRLGEGFHGFDSGARWTDGSATLPAALWDGCKGTFFLRVTLAGPALPRWVAPGETAGVVNLAERRQA